MKVENGIRDARTVEERVASYFGIAINNLDILEIGPGQFLTQLYYFSRCNRVTGIDRDVIVQEFGLTGYAEMLRVNGFYRTAKTIVRKALGIDLQYRIQLRTLLGVEKLPTLRVCCMDVTKTSFPSASFDFVYCRAVLHHLLNPEVALEEISRLLRPGGITYISIHPYTSETGCLDPRIYTGRCQEVLGWPHLRPSLMESLHAPNACLNRLRLDDWRALFTAKMPGSRFLLVSGDPSRREVAMRLREQGELLNYSLEELLTGEFIACWRKGKPSELKGPSSGD